jgi:hypothetical protein
MYIINSRALTTQQLSKNSSSEPLPLTPNNLLGLHPPPGNFEEPDIYSRKRWRRIQYLAEKFWCRWKLEYLQTLQTRSKWNEKKQNRKVTWYS